MIKMKQIYQRFFSMGIIILIIIPTILLSQDLPEGGCTDEAACNYDPDAIVDDGSCEEFDCAGECGGDATDLGCGCGEEAPSGCDNNCESTLENDECGVCNGDNSTCTGCTEDLACNYEENATIDCNNCCEYPEDNYDCDGNCTIGEDCFGTCGGAAFIDNCGTCDGGSLCDGQMVQGQCINGKFNVGEFNINGFDCAGWCLGTFSYGSNECYDCVNTPNGTAEPDECGICSGGDSEHIANSDQDCTGECFGNSVLDACGVCNGDGFSCQFGCVDENASNYYCGDDVNLCVNDQLPEGFIDDGSCTYDIEGIVKYFDSEATPIKDVMVTIYGSAVGMNYFIDSDSTDTNGDFTIPNVPIQNTDDGTNVFSYEFYYLEYSYTEDSYLGINMIDAILISDVVIALEIFPYDSPLANYSSIAADVNLDGRINSYDSSLIGRFTNDSSFSMNESNTRWKFVSGMDTITNLTDNEYIVIYGIKLGDPNGSWE